MASSESNGKVIISFKDKSGNRMVYKVKRDMKLLKLLKNYSSDKNLEYASVNFLHNGERLHRRGTVAQAGFEDEDEIDVVEYADGGGLSK